MDCVLSLLISVLRCLLIVVVVVLCCGLERSWCCLCSLVCSVCLVCLMLFDMVLSLG